MPEDEDKAWAEFERAERDGARRKLTDEKERRLRSLGLRPNAPVSRCIHCGQPIDADSTGKDFGFCQSCID